MKKLFYMLCLLFLGILLTTKPVDAKVNKDAFNRHRDVFDNGKDCRTLYDNGGNVYLQYNNSQYVYLVSTPDAKNGETTLVIPDTVQIDNKIHFIGGVGADDAYEAGETVFSIGRNYKEIVFGKYVDFIERYSFGGYDTLEKIQFLGNDIYIGDWAFPGCENLKQVMGSEKITSIGEHGFSETAITHFIISDKCRAIWDHAFSGCTNLKELPDISKVQTLGEGIFVSCHGVKRIILPDGIKEIPGHMFSDCKNVKEVYIPKSVKRIGENAFWGSTKLKGNVTIDPENKHFTAKDNMILNKKGDTLLSMISPVKVMVIPSYVKKVKSYWAQDCEKSDKDKSRMLETIIVQNKDVKFLEKSMPSWYSPGYRKQKINILYPNNRNAFVFKEKQVDYIGGKFTPSKYFNQRPYTLYTAPTKVKAKLKKGKVQVSFKKLKNSTVKKYKITYRIKKNGKYKAQKEKVVKGKRAILCALKKGETCEVRVSAYTKQSGVWLPGKFSRMVKVRGK